MATRIIIFLLLNFAALGLGSMFTSNGVSSDWYAGLAKAPWTPPGWMFGAAWTTIMICFAVYMASAWESSEAKTGLIALFAVQWILNVAWNPVFFKFHHSLAALFIITGLTILVGYMLFRYLPALQIRSLLILPYFIWLVIATSLNAYISFMN